jgi:GH15 family glucan-1,4-alpha-glucosidase
MKCVDKQLGMNAGNQNTFPDSVWGTLIWKKSLVWICLALMKLLFHIYCLPLFNFMIQIEKPVIARIDIFISKY